MACQVQDKEFKCLKEIVEKQHFETMPVWQSADRMFTYTCLSAHMPIISLAEPSIYTQGKSIHCMGDMSLNSFGAMKKLFF